MDSYENSPTCHFDTLGVVCASVEDGKERKHTNMSWWHVGGRIGWHQGRTAEENPPTCHFDTLGVVCANVKDGWGRKRTQGGEMWWRITLSTWSCDFKLLRVGSIDLKKFYFLSVARLAWSAKYTWLVRAHPKVFKPPFKLSSVYFITTAYYCG